MTQPNPFDLEPGEEELDGCIGDVTPDPWADEKQTDWPNNAEEVSE